MKSEADLCMFINSCKFRVFSKHPLCSLSQRLGAQPPLSESPHVSMAYHIENGQPKFILLGHVASHFLYLIYGTVVYYLDDILITGASTEEHEQNLRKVMDRLQKIWLRVNAAKCKYFQLELEILGHVITPSGISPTQQRIADVLKAPVPSNKGELKSFLGLMTYNAKFIPSVASLLHPLYQLLRKDVHWKWTSKCQEAFERDRALVSKAPVLVHYDVNKPIKLYCDALGRGI